VSNRRTGFLGALALLVVSSLLACPARRLALNQFPPPIQMDGNLAERRQRAAELITKTLSFDWTFGDRPSLTYANDREIRFSFQNTVHTGPFTERKTTYRTLSWQDVAETRIRRHTDPFVVAYVVEVHLKTPSEQHPDHYDWFAPDEQRAMQLAWAVEYLAAHVAPPSAPTAAPRSTTTTGATTSVPRGGCMNDEQCKGDRRCLAGRCRAPDWSPAAACTRDIDCPGDWICEQKRCQQPAAAADAGAPEPTPEPD